MSEKKKLQINTSAAIFHLCVGSSASISHTFAIFSAYHAYKQAYIIIRARNCSYCQRQKKEPYLKQILSTCFSKKKKKKNSQHNYKFGANLPKAT